MAGDGAIRVVPEVLAAQISVLEGLIVNSTVAQFGTSVVDPVLATSSGDVADKLGQISEELRSAVLQLYALIIATTNALKNVHGSIVEADETAAQQIATGVVLK